MARPTVNAKKTTISIRLGLDGWADYQAMRLKPDGGLVAYLNELMEEDRARTVAAGGTEAERYALFLGATGREEEAAAMDDGPRVTLEGGEERLDGMTREEWAGLTIEDAACIAERLGVPLGAVTEWTVGKH